MARKCHSQPNYKSNWIFYKVTVILDPSESCGHRVIYENVSLFREHAGSTAALSFSRGAGRGDRGYGAVVVVPRSIQAALSKHHRLGNLKTTHIYFSQFEIREPALLNEGPLPGS